ncbi:PAS domain-containing protein [Thermodesulfobacteriota bacterium]
MKENEQNRDHLLAEIKSLQKKLTELESFKKDQKQIEQELQKSKEVLEMIINNIPNQVFWKSRDLAYIGSNQAFAEVTGMSDPSEVIGKTDYDFHRDSTHADSYREWDKKIMDSGEPVLDIEESYHNADGTEGTVLTSKVPLRDKKGNVFGLLGICTDITERKKMELENESLIRELKDAISQVKTLSGLLPICSNCKKIRDDKGYWEQIESYITAHTDAEFSHSICQDCAKKLYPGLVDENGNFFNKS